MSDRELLEAAASAAGYTLLDVLLIGRGIATAEIGYWNPIESDGEAFRLAVKLCLTADHDHRLKGFDGHDGEYEPAVLVYDMRGAVLAEVPHGNDPYTATRRAIVKAAAALAKAPA